MRSVVFKNKTTKYYIAGGILVFILLYFFWVFSWSAQGEGLKKGKIGLDPCHQCGMLLSDQKTVVSILEKDEYNHDVTHHFDDIGCFLTYASLHKKEKWVGVAYDYESQQEIPLSSANFEKTNYRTPMGSGWIIKKNLGPQTSDLMTTLEKIR